MWIMGLWFKFLRAQYGLEGGWAKCGIQSIGVVETYILSVS